MAGAASAAVNENKLTGLQRRAVIKRLPTSDRHQRQGRRRQIVNGIGHLGELPFGYHCCFRIGSHGAADAAVAEAHAISRLHLGHGITESCHHAHAVMAQDEGLIAGDIASQLPEEHVGGIEGCGTKLDQNVIWAARPLQFDILQFQDFRPTGFCGDNGLDLHLALSFISL